MVGNSGSPAYGPVVEALAQNIRSGRYRLEERLPSEMDLARQFGVSRGSVRKALAILASRGLVRRAASRGSFVTSPESREAEGAPARRLAVIMPDPADPLCARIIAGVSSSAARHSLEPVLGASWGEPAAEAALLARAVDRGDAGAILFPTDERLVGEPVVKISSGGFPVVLVDRFLPGTGLDLVRSAHQTGASTLVQWLVQMGHKEIAFLTTDNLTTRSISERWAGYREALAAAGIPYRWDRVWVLPGPNGSDAERHAVAEYLAAPGRPTAVFALNDSIARLLIEVAAAAGVRVPQDLSVVGFDGLEEGERGGQIVTMRQPARAVGAQAVELLVRRLRGTVPPPPVTCTLPVEFVPGRSAAARVEADAPARGPAGRTEQRGANPTAPATGQHTPASC